MVSPELPELQPKGKGKDGNMDRKKFLFLVMPITILVIVLVAWAISRKTSSSYTLPSPEKAARIIEKECKGERFVAKAKCMQYQFNAYTNVYEIERKQGVWGTLGFLDFPSPMHCKKMWRNKFHMRLQCQQNVDARRRELAEDPASEAPRMEVE